MSQICDDNKKLKAIKNKNFWPRVMNSAAFIYCFVLDVVTHNVSILHFIYFI
jgi:hypothetical protein